MSDDPDPPTVSEVVEDRVLLHVCGEPTLFPKERRESVGFGRHNKLIRTFCSTDCEARWFGEDAVLLDTEQTTLVDGRI